MRFFLISIILVVFSTGSLASEAIDLRHKGVEAASKGDFETAQKFLGQSAKLGFYTAQVEYAYLLESSPESVKNNAESYAWYQVVIARNGTDTEFAKDGLSRLMKTMPDEELQQAKEITIKYIKLYAK
ncbi:MAG: hypothetical protein V2I33_01995 [Kangiellaceae bacterium]|jgi:TPR repeat protein|nr:hypothetical protein [Kangiellaceae bacterium]